MTNHTRWNGIVRPYGPQPVDLLWPVRPHNPIPPRMVGHSISSLTIQEHKGAFSKRSGTPRPTGPKRTGREARKRATALAFPQGRELSVTATTATQSETAGIIGSTTGAQDRVLTPQAVEFLVKLSTDRKSVV